MSKRILIVDDEPRLLGAVAETLSEEGYQAATARSGMEALVQIAKSLPDLIISDVRMPGMDGYRLVSKLRSNPRTDMIPIIFLTAKDKREDRITGFKNGIDAYITKPFDPEELLVIIANILNRAARISSELARLIGSPENENEPNEIIFDEELTGSERRVAALVTKGMSNKEIAAQIDVSVRTVEGHISNILSKKGWNNRVEIVLNILKQNSAL
jgi:DNA-binding NarL/FixJ family response regulator